MEVKLEHAIAIASTVGAFLLSVFLSGKREGRMEKRLDDSEKKSLELEDEFRRKIADLVRDLEEIDKRFEGSDGDPRFMTSTAHEKVQIACQMLMRQRLDDHDRNIDKLFKKIDAMNELLFDMIPYIVRRGDLADILEKNNKRKHQDDEQQG